MCRAEPEGVPLAEGPCPTNDMVLCLLHSCLGQELSDREIPLTPTDQAAFLNEVLRRSCRDPGEFPGEAFPTPRWFPSLGSGLLPTLSPQSPASLLVLLLSTLSAPL